MTPPWLIPFLLVPALWLAGCAGTTEEVIGTGTGPRVTGEPSGPSFGSPPDPSSAPIAPAGMPQSAAVQVDIPALGVSEQTVPLGLAADGTMEMPLGPDRLITCAGDYSPKTPGYSDNVVVYATTRLVTGLAAETR